MNRQTAQALHQAACTWADEGRPAIVVEVLSIKGSTPRNAGTRMLVSASDVLGTVGGGHLEWRAIGVARQALGECAGSPDDAPAVKSIKDVDAVKASWRQDFALGPSLGQCCGGALTLGFSWLTADKAQAWPQATARFHLELHGAGHVGQALIQLLSGLDCTVRWIDERGDDDELSAPGLPSSEMLAALPRHIQWLPTDAADHDVADAPPGACHLVLTHRHDLDLRIVRAILQKGDAHFVGLIGSQTKGAQFRRRLAEQGLTQAMIDTMVCPIGMDGIKGKEPMVIAISAVAQLLKQTPP